MCDTYLWSDSFQDENSFMGLEFFDHQQSYFGGEFESSCSGGDCYSPSNIGNIKQCSGTGLQLEDTQIDDILPTCSTQLPATSACNQPNLTISLNATTDTSREQKISKYRAKRAKRNFSKQIDNKLSDIAKNRKRDESGHFLPKRKSQKTDLENLFLSNEMECESLRNKLQVTSQELKTLKIQFENQKKQLRVLRETHPNYNEVNCGEYYYEDADSEESSTTTTGFSDDTITSDLSEFNKYEKFKKLGGPPSDVYYPWRNGANLKHPAFAQKEDWTSFELRPNCVDPTRITRERLGYVLTQKCWKQEQLMLAESRQDLNSGMSSVQRSSPSSSPLLPTSKNSYVNLHSHSSTMSSGGPNIKSGYWSGNFVPQAEYIDFSKVELRRTGLEISDPRSLSSESSTPLENTDFQNAHLQSKSFEDIHFRDSDLQNSQLETWPISTSPESPANLDTWGGEPIDSSDFFDGIPNSQQNFQIDSHRTKNLSDIPYIQPHNNSEYQQQTNDLNLNSHNHLQISDFSDNRLFLKTF